MVRNTGTEGQKPADQKPGSRQRLNEPQIQAAFDFLPQEMRHHLRFGDVLRAGRADLASQSRMIDRQVIGLGSRIAAARLREILRPASDWGASEPETAEQGRTMTSPEDLAQQRDILREIGTAVFYFRDEDDTASQSDMPTQRLHPRPLPARYYGAPPQQAGAGPLQADWMPPLPQRKIA